MILPASFWTYLGRLQVLLIQGFYCKIILVFQSVSILSRPGWFGDLNDFEFPSSDDLNIEPDDYQKYVNEFFVSHMGSYIQRRDQTCVISGSVFGNRSAHVAPVCLIGAKTETGNVYYGREPWSIIVWWLLYHPDHPEDFNQTFGPMIPPVYSGMHAQIWLHKSLEELQEQGVFTIRIGTKTALDNIYERPEFGTLADWKREADSANLIYRVQTINKEAGYTTEMMAHKRRTLLANQHTGEEAVEGNLHPLLNDIPVYATALSKYGPNHRLRPPLAQLMSITAAIAMNSYKRRIHRQDDGQFQGLYFKGGQYKRAGFNRPSRP